MFRIVICLAAVLFAGCSQHRYDVADPVVGPPPPRKQNLEQVAYDAEQKTEVQLTSFEADEPIAMTEVVARVNGTPILAGQVLEPYAGKLAEASKKLPPSEIRKAQEMLLQKNLQAQIEQTLMVDSVKSKLQKEQMEQISSQLDEFFDLEVERLKAQFKVSNVAELEALLQSQGMSLVTMREMFGNRQLATEYIRGKMGEESPLTRQDLLKAYNARKDEFAQPEQVKWQQIQISITKHGSRDAALEKLSAVIADLEQGIDFSVVAKTHSDGPLKENGGHWDWTQPTSIANEDVRQALSQLSTGEMSGVIESGSSLQIVKVTGRKPATHTPFSEVQEKIRAEIIEKQRSEKAKQIIAELKQDAIIETMFDDGFAQNQTAEK